MPLPPRDFSKIGPYEGARGSVGEGTCAPCRCSPRDRALPDRALPGVGGHRLRHSRHLSGGREPRGFSFL